MEIPEIPMKKFFILLTSLALVISCESNKKNPQNNQTDLDLNPALSNPEPALNSTQDTQNNAYDQHQSEVCESNVASDYESAILQCDSISSLLNAEECKLALEQFKAKHLGILCAYQRNHDLNEAILLITESYIDDILNNLLLLKEFYITSGQDSALRPIFEDIAIIHGLFNGTPNDLIRLNLIECKTKQDPENECSEIALREISYIRKVLLKIVFHIEKTISQDRVFVSPSNFSDFSEAEASSHLQDREETERRRHGVDEPTHLNTGTEGKTGMLYSLGNWLNNHVGDQDQPLPFWIPNEIDEASETTDETDQTSETNGTHKMRRLVNTNNLRSIPNPRILYNLFDKYISLATYLPQYPNLSQYPMNKDNNINTICTSAVKTNKATSELRKSIDLAWDVYRFHLEQYKEFFTQQIERAKNNFASALSNKINREFLFSSDASIQSYVNDLSNSSLQNIFLSLPEINHHPPSKHLLINKIIHVRNSNLNILKTHLLGTHPNTRNDLNENARQFVLARLALETTIRGGFGDENINYHFESLQNLRRTIVRSPSHYFDRDSRLNSVVIARESDINQNLNSFREWMKRVEEWKLMRWVEEGEVHFDVIPERLPIPSTDELKIAIQNAQRLLGFGNPTGIRDLLNEASGQDDLEPNENCVTAFNNSLVL